MVCKGLIVVEINRRRGVGVGEEEAEGAKASPQCHRARSVPQRFLSSPSPAVVDHYTLLPLCLMTVSLSCAGIQYVKSKVVRTPVGCTL